jgi:peptidoglycan/LPS O-acetylase OafA/YrhL
VPRNANRIASLDGLRAASVVLVLLGHESNCTAAPGWLRLAEPYANFGVRVFFVISGFLITHLLLREHERNGTIGLGGFYVRRFYRIFPAAYAFMAVVVVARWSTLTATDIATAFAYLSNYHQARPWVLGHLWSLAVEEQFYLLWPFVLLLWFPRRREVVIVTICAAPVVRALLFLLHRPEGAYMWFPSLADALATGALLAIVRPELERWGRFLASKWMLVVPAATLALVQLGQATLLGRYTNAAFWVFVIPFVHLGIALTIDHCIRRPYAILNAAPVAWVGVLSYSIYLWQQPFLTPHGAAVWQRFPVNLALALLAGAASYYAIEKPVLAFRERRAAPKLPPEAIGASGS